MNDTANTKKNSNSTTRDLQKKVTAIREAYKAIESNEMSSAKKSYIIGKNLNELHSDEQFKQLTDDDGKNYQKWEAFCKTAFGFSRAYADKLMKCAEIQDKLEKAGVTKINQSVANLYAIHNREDAAAIWKKATEDNPEAFPARKTVQQTIHSETPADNASQSDRKELNNLVRTIKSLSEENKQKVQAFLNDLLHKTEDAGTADKTEKLSA